MCMEQPKLAFMNIDLQVSSCRIRINCHTIELISQLSMFRIAARTFEWTDGTLYSCGSPIVNRRAKAKSCARRN
jgi:hypothetical protein